MRQLFEHTDPDGEAVQVLAMDQRGHALVLAATDGDGEHATVNLPRGDVTELHRVLGEWLNLSPGGKPAPC